MSQRKRNLVVAAFIGLGAIVLGFGIGSFSIYRGIRDIAEEASAAHEGDKITALMAYVDDESHGLHRRDKAVWALGQLGDARALPVLERFDTGESCDHSRYLCQRELCKAIRKCRGAVNITSWVNRFALRTP